MRMRTMILSLVSCAALAACASTNGDTSTGSAEDEAAIRQMADDWAAKYNARDAAGIAALMSADYHEVVATGEHSSSSAEAQAMLEQEFSQFPEGSAVSLTTEFVQFLDGNDAFSGGTYQVTGMPEGMPNRGSWLVVSSRDSTGWKIRSGLGSADISFLAPAAPAQE